MRCGNGKYTNKTKDKAGVCESCSTNYVDKDSDPGTPCIACKACAPSERQTAKCDLKKDTQCSVCGKGTYANKTKDKGGECQPCNANYIDGDADPSTPCVPCRVCDASSVVKSRCQGLRDTECERCGSGTWADVSGAARNCTVCAQCPSKLRRITVAKCTARSDALCATCPRLGCLVRGVCK